MTDNHDSQGLTALKIFVLVAITMILAGVIALFVTSLHTGPPGFVPV